MRVVLPSESLQGHSSDLRNSVVLAFSVRWVTVAKLRRYIISGFDGLVLHVPRPYLDVFVSQVAVRVDDGSATIRISASSVSFLALAIHEGSRPQLMNERSDP